MVTLSGQWHGKSDDNQTEVILDLDEYPPGTRGSGRIFFAPYVPGAICHLQLPDFEHDHTLETQFYWMAPNAPYVMNVEQVLEHFPGYDFGKNATLKLRREGDVLLLDWEAPQGNAGSIRLNRSEMKSPSRLVAERLTWGQFKDRALGYTAGDMIFRGQSAPHRLRSAFHRTYRKDLITYVSQDVPYVHRQLTARTSHIFDLTSGAEAGAFYNLLQHHGYPTPLLDWTYSPFVAAFFAYRRRRENYDDEGCVRIFGFNKSTWTADFPQLESINFTRPHFSMLEALAIENPRAIPQQAISSLTNVDDIEGYILSKEAETGRRYLYAFDILADVRPQVMAELSLMGITAGSLFPGLDGACEELMGRFFHHQVPPIGSRSTD